MNLETPRHHFVSTVSPFLCVVLNSEQWRSYVYSYGNDVLFVFLHEHTMTMTTIVTAVAAKIATIIINFCIYLRAYWTAQRPNVMLPSAKKDANQIHKKDGDDNNNNSVQLFNSLPASWTVKGRIISLPRTNELYKTNTDTNRKKMGRVSFRQ